MKKLILLAFLWALPAFAQQQIPITGGVVTADMSTGTTSFKVNLNQNVTSVVLTGQRPGSGGNTVICTIFFVQDTTGGWTVTFGGNIISSFPVTSTPSSVTIEQFAFDFSSNSWSVVNAGSAGSSGISGSGTPNTLAMFTSSNSIGNGPVFVANGVTQSTNPLSQPASLFSCTNSASGTTNGLLVTRDSNGNCINLPAAQTTKIVGVVYVGGGTSGTALICKIGTCPVTLDNTSVIDDCIVAAATGSQGHDAGATCPTGVQQIGIAQNVNGGTGTAANVDVFISDITPGATGPVQNIQVNGTTLAGTLDNFNGTTPSAGANNQNLTFQTDNGSPTSNVSVEVPLATAGQPGIMQLAGDLSGGTDVAPTVTGIQTIPVTVTSPAANDVLCFPTSSTIANCKQGVPIRSVSGNSDAILSSDRVSDVRYTAASGATAVTLSQAGSAGFANNITFILTNAQGSGTVTVTPSTSTINGNATLAIPAGNYCFVYSDNTNYFANCGQSAGGSSGTVTSVAQTVPSWLTVGGSPITTSGTLAITAATGQTSHQVIGTCGTATSFAPCTLVAGDIPSAIRTHGLVFSYGDPGNTSAITAGSTATDYMTVPFACTISAYNILIDAGTITIKFWKVATGTAIPTSGNSINTSGVAISSGTAIHSTTLTDFTSTAVSANDIIAMNVSTVATAKFVSATLECDQ